MASRFLDLAHTFALPGGVQDHDTLGGRVQHELLLVMLGVEHSSLLRVPLDFQVVDISLGRLALQSVGGAELFEIGFRRLHVQLVLGGIDLGKDGVFLDLQLVLVQLVLGRFQLGIVLGAGGGLVGLLLGDLIHQVLILRLPIHVVLHLALAVELGQHVACLYPGSGRREFRNHHLVAAGTLQPGRQNRKRVHCLHRTADAQHTDEIAPLRHRRTGCAAGCGALASAGRRPHGDRDRCHGDHQRSGPVSSPRPGLPRSRWGRNNPQFRRSRNYLHWHFGERCRGSIQDGFCEVRQRSPSRLPSKP